MQAAKKGNHEKSTKLIQQIALQWEPKWMYDLALKYRDGICIPESLIHAEFWLRMSAEHGYPDAIIALAGFRSASGPHGNLLKESEQILTKAVNRGYITQKVKDHNMEFLVSQNDQEIRKATKIVEKATRTVDVIYDFPAGSSV